MAYKYVNDNGLKAYTKKVKNALKNLHTPIAISTEDTTESKAQNVKNIAYFVAKAKAAGIADVNGMAVTCLIDNDYSGVGYLYKEANNLAVFGVISSDDVNMNCVFRIDTTGAYNEDTLLTATFSNVITSDMLVQGARRPIILTPETTKVDEETYQKLLSDDVDVVFRATNKVCALTYKSATDVNLCLCFSAFSIEGEIFDDMYIYGYQVYITKTGAHSCTVTSFNDEEVELHSILIAAGILDKNVLTPVLQEIDLSGTDAERKAKLAKFEADWKNLTGADDMTGTRFVGRVQGEDFTGVFTWSIGNAGYVAFVDGGERPESKKVFLNQADGSLVITPLFSHLEPVEIFLDNSAALKQKNLDNLNAYKANLEQLGVDTSMSFQVPIRLGKKASIIGILQYTVDADTYVGVCCASDEDIARILRISSTGEGTFTNLAPYKDAQQAKTLANAVKAFGAIELKASDNAANKAALTAYKKILTDAGVSITNGYSVPVRITGNAQEYHGMLNIGTGVLLSGIVTDVNENHHYPFNVSTADGAITFDANNYFLEKTSNEVTEMLDAIKYSYTPVPLTATTLSNKAQLEVFLSKVPTAQVMHCTYKDVYAGTLHKINGDWFGLLVKNTNNYEDALQVKLQADGTLIEGTTSLAQVNAKLDTIIG